MKSFFHECNQFRLLACPISRQILMEGLGYMCKSFDEPSVVTYQAQKGSDISVGLGQCTSCDHLQVILTWSYTILQDVMTQVVDLTLEELTFVGLILRLCSQNKTQHIDNADAPLPSSRRQSYHWDKSDSMSDSTCLSSSASIIERWL